MKKYEYYNYEFTDKLLSRDEELDNFFNEEKYNRPTEISEKDDFNISVEIPDQDDFYKPYDEYCDRMNSCKYMIGEKMLLAEMGKYVTSTLEKTIIGTSALDTCYGILFYDRERKEEICGHAIPSRLTMLLAEMMKWFGSESRNIEYLILPGFRNIERKNYSGLNELLDYLFEKVPDNIALEKMNVSDSDIRLHQNTLSYEFAFDTTDGSFVTDMAFFDSTEHNPRFIAPKKRY